MKKTIIVIALFSILSAAQAGADSTVLPECASSPEIIGALVARPQADVIDRLSTALTRLLNGKPIHPSKAEPKTEITDACRSTVAGAIKQLATEDSKAAVKLLIKETQEKTVSGPQGVLVAN